MKVTRNTRKEAAYLLKDEAVDDAALLQWQVFESKGEPPSIPLDGFHRLVAAKSGRQLAVTTMATAYWNDPPARDPLLVAVQWPGWLELGIECAENPRLYWEVFLAIAARRIPCGWTECEGCSPADCAPTPEVRARIEERLRLGGVARPPLRFAYGGPTDPE